MVHAAAATESIARCFNGRGCTMVPPSEDEPGEHQQRVVVAGVMSGTVEVAPAPVELGIGGVLDAKLQVHKRRPKRGVLAEWHPVGLDNEGVAVWLVVDGSGAGDAEQHRVRRPPCSLPTQCQAVGIL